MGMKTALEGEKHAHVNVGESRSQLKIPQKTVNLAAVFTERRRKRPPPWTLPAHGFFLAPLP